MDVYTAAYGLPEEELKKRLDKLEAEIFALPVDTTSSEALFHYMDRSFQIMDSSGQGAKREYVQCRLNAIKQVVKLKFNGEVDDLGADELAEAEDELEDQLNPFSVIKGNLYSMEHLGDKTLIRKLVAGNQVIEFGSLRLGFAYDTFDLESPEVFYRNSVDDIVDGEVLFHRMREDIRAYVGDWISYNEEGFTTALASCVLKEPEISEQIFGLPERFPNLHPTQEEISQREDEIRKHIGLDDQG